jgi:cof family protein
MIEYAGLGVAMGNAPDAIKALADVTTTSNEEDGVATAIKRYVLQAQN